MKAIVILLFCSLVVFAQTNNKTIEIHGKIVDGETNFPLVGANVFLNGTLYGTTTDINGDFKITNIPGSYYKLIVSMLGFETSVKIIESVKKNNYIKEKLFPKTYSLDSVFVITTEAEEWHRCLELFTGDFLGQTKYADDCKILNPYSIQFEYNESTDNLIAHCDSFLFVKNNATGYIQKVDLLLFDFNYDLRDGYGSILFYMFYENLDGDEDQIATWKKNKESIFKFGPRGFLMNLREHPLKRPLNLVEKNNKAIYSNWINPYETILLKPDTLVAFAVPNSDLCYIPHSRIPEIQIQKANAKSSISLIEDNLYFNRYGKVLNGENIIFGGYWGTYRIATLLPSNYYPQSK